MVPGHSALADTVSGDVLASASSFSRMFVCAEDHRDLSESA